MSRPIGLLVDEDVEFLGATAGVLCLQVDIVCAGRGGHREGVAFLVDVDELIGVHGHLLGFVGSGDVHLLGRLHVAPLGFAVIPNDGFGRSGMELVALDGYGATGGSYFRT